MANREQGEVSLVLGGKTYTLRLSLNTLCDLEDKFSTPEQEVGFQEIAKRLSQMRLRDLRTVLWAALREYHAEDIPTPEAAGKLLQVSEIPKILPAIQQLFLPDRDDVKTDRPQKAQTDAGRGGTSTSAPAKSA